MKTIDSSSGKKTSSSKKPVPAETPARTKESALTNEDLQILVQSAHELTSEIELSSLLNNILKKVCTLTDSPDSSVILHNEKKNSLYIAEATGGDAEMLLRRWGEFSEKQIPVQGSKAGQVFVSQKSLVEDSVVDHFKAVDQDTRKKTKSMVCVPLKIAGKSFGVMQVLNKQSGNYTERDVTLLECFADQATVAIRNARMFIDLLGHMGLYETYHNGGGPLKLMEELYKPAHAETLTIMIPDMRGFTQFCQMLNDPVEAQRRCDEFVTILIQEVLGFHGVVNKVLGDGLIALFRYENHAERAVRCAFSIVDRFEELKRRWDQESNIVLDFIDIGIGIVTDEVIVGAIGGERVRDFTVIGNAVNLAVSYEDEARDGRRILVDQVTYNSVKDIVKEVDGPFQHELKKQGKGSGRLYKQYHLKSLDPPPCIFVSHSHADHDFVNERLVKPLAEYKIKTWFSHDDIPKGNIWMREILEGLRMCQWMIMVVSKNSAQSEWVKEELYLAKADPKFKGRIIPVVVDDTKLEDVSEYLKLMQAVEAGKTDDIAQQIASRILNIR
jgi:class 3 adenylate cyclase/putative methionine-R-sulfoxide reductase with GAF domain